MRHSQLRMPVSTQLGSAKTALPACRNAFVRTKESGLLRYHCSALVRLCITMMPEADAFCPGLYCGSSNYLQAQWPMNTLSLTSAIGMCLPGWTGSPTRYCDGSGAWSSTVSNPCVQMFCPAFSADDSSWPLTPAGSTAIEGTCASGYAGIPYRSCDFYGNWGSITSHCTRLLCPASNDGNAAWPTTRSFESAFGTCVSGFEGTPQRTCGANGTFGAIINPCVNRRCFATYEGNAQWSQANAGTSTVFGECGAGWTGWPTRACDINGNWLTIQSSCVRLTCPATDDPDAQATFPQVNAGVSNVPGTCYAHTAGFPSRDCLVNGTWSAVINPCSTSPCPALTNNANADWPATNATNVLVTGTCRAGYLSASVPQRVCNGDGSWNTDIINPCQPIYCTHGSPSYSAFNAQWPSSVQAGYSASGSCLAGYSGTTSRSCSISGTWNTPSPLCQAIYCAPIADDGMHASWLSTQAGFPSTGTCLTGYEGSPTRVCSVSGLWQSVVSPCTQRKCPSITEGRAVWSETLSGAITTGQCEVGTAGTVTRQCSIDGVWQPISGSCTQMYCVSETFNNIVWPTAMPGSTSVGECAVGYVVVSLPQRACLPTGLWGSAIGACMRRQCHGVTFANAVWETVNSMTYGVYGTCEPGWEGTPQRDCTDDGVFTTVINPCTQKKCPSFTDSYGTWSTTLSGSTSVPGTCLAGYTGSPTRSCGTSGLWGAVSDACVPRSCPAVSSGNVEWPATAAGQTFSGTCESGFYGLPSRPCGLNGEWGGISNPCQQRFCPQMDESNARWPRTAALAPDAEGACAFKYTGSPTRPCTASGAWGPVSNPCELIYCADAYHDFTTWTRSPAGTTSFGSCASGYGGRPSRMCLDTGIWSSSITQPCQCAYFVAILYTCSHQFFHW